MTVAESQSDKLQGIAAALHARFVQDDRPENGAPARSSLLL